MNEEIPLRRTNHLSTSVFAPLEQKAESMPMMFERLARDQAMDVDKLERLMQMYERAQARVAEEQFNAAMSQAQTKMRPVAVDADNPQTRSKYASYAALDRALRPIYTECGFGVSFDMGETQAADHVRILAYVTHLAGHARTYHVDMPADGKGAKGGDVMTKTHATGAAMSYGMRYLQKMIWNVAVGEDDRDGNAVDAETPATTQPPTSPRTVAAPSGVGGAGLISESQQKRMYAIASSRGWSNVAYKAFLRLRGYDSDRMVPKRVYDGLVAELQAGPTP